MKITGITSLNQTHLFTTTVTYPRSINIYHGHYPEKYITHNLRLKIDKLIKENPDKEQTNVYGQKTQWNAFNEDAEFLKFMTYVVEKLAVSNSQDFIAFNDRYELETWGHVLSKDDYIRIHIHNCYHCVFYLTDGVDLVLPELGLSLTPKAGDWYVLPPFVNHGTPKIKNKKNRYTIVCNLLTKNDWKRLKDLGMY